MCGNCGHNHHNKHNHSHDELKNLIIDFESPIYYEILTDEEKVDFKAELEKNFCKIIYPEQEAYFIKGFFQIPIKPKQNGEFLNFLVWISISKEDFYDYKANFENKDYKKEVFGYFSNNLFGYEYCIYIRAEISFSGSQEPIISLDKDFPHALVKDFYEGMEHEKLHFILDHAM